MRSVRQLGSIALISVAYSVVAVAALHVLDTDPDPVEHFIREYALGDYGWLMKSVFFAAGLGVWRTALWFAIAMVIWRVVGDRPPQRVAAGAGPAGLRCHHDDLAGHPRVANASPGPYREVARAKFRRRLPCGLERRT